MAPFTYERYTSPYANTIAQMLLHQNDPQAQAAQTIAAANARAGEISANAWGGAVKGMTDAFSHTVDTIAREQEVAPKLESEKIALANLQQEQKGKAYLNTLLAGDQLQPDQEGPRLPSVFDPQTKLYDIPTLTQQLATSNYPPELVKTAQSINDGVVERQQTMIKLGQQNALLRGDYAHAVLTLVKQTGQAPLDAMDSLVKIGTPGISPDQYAQNIRPQFASLSPEQQTAQLNGMMDQAAQLDKGETLAQGAVKIDRYDRVTAKGLDKPMTRVELGVLATDKTKTPAERQAAADALKAAFPQATPRPESLQTRDATIDGKPGFVMVDPDPKATQHVYDLEGKPIENAATRVKLVTPPSIIIHNDQKQVTPLPGWALDASRPSGDAGNVLDDNIRMTPNGLYQAALNYIANGQFPPTGRGSDTVAIAQRAAVNSKVGAIAAAAGMDEVGLRQFYRASGASLAEQQKMQDAVQGFMATADKNAALLQGTLKTIPDTNIPIFNQPLRVFATKVAGDPNMAQVATYLSSVRSEYGRIITQPNLAGILTDTARHEAEQLVSGDATVAQMLASLQALQNEGENRVQSVGEQIQRIQKRVQDGPGGDTAVAAARTTRAQQVLSAAHMASDPASVATFLKNNPTFK